MIEHEWVTIDVGGELVEVSRDAPKRDGQRFPQSYDDALAFAAQIGGELPTPEVLDARWEASDLKNPPHPQDLAHGQNDPALHSRLIDQDISAFRALHGRDPHITGNPGKSWVHSPYSTGAPLYGWFVSPGMVAPAPTHPASSTRTISRVIQPAAIAPKTFHNRQHADYSAFQVYMRRCPSSDRNERVTAPPSAPTPTRPGDPNREAVKAWQRYLNAAGFGLLKTDGLHGPKTEAATQAWRLAQTALEHDTEPHTPVLSVELPPIAFMEAKHFTVAHRATVHWVVIHTMEAAETSTTAERVSRWASKLNPDAPRVSWHYAVDDDTIVQMVHEAHVAWAAPNMNRYGIQIELAGYARQTAAEWDDAFSRAQLDLTALLCAHVCKRWNIPARHLTVEELRAGERGIVGHWDGTKAFKVAGGHVDPGPAYPFDRLVENTRMNLSLL